MTGDGEALFRAICEHPQEDTPRLIYADWLEENGQAERAEFIRIQIEIANRSVGDPRRRELFTRGDKLAYIYETKWRQECPEFPGVYWRKLMFRGFWESIGIGADQFQQIQDVLFASQPIRRLELYRLTRRSFGQILRSRHLVGLTHLRLWSDESWFDDRSATALAKCSSLSGLISLRLPGGPVTDTGAAAMIFSDHLSGLRGLDICADRVLQWTAQAIDLELERREHGA